MITKKTKLKDKIKYDIKCDKCGKNTAREAKKEISNEISNSLSAFCDKCMPQFIEWVRKSYPQDCWCRHIEEYKTT